MWGEFEDAVSLSIAPNGSAYVADKHSAKIYWFSFQKKKIHSFGGSGWGDYSFDTPVDIMATFLLELYVVDANNRRVQQFDRSLNFVQTYDENLDERTVGKFLPRSVAVSRFGNIFILETDGHRVIKLNTRKQVERIFGTVGDGKGRLQAPLDLCITPDGKVLVLDDYKVKIFDEYGNFISSIMLADDIEWKSISSYANGFLVTALHQINLYSGENAVLTEIPIKNILSLQGENLLSDAAIVDSTLYVLTQHHLFRCSLSP